MPLCAVHSEALKSALGQYEIGQPCQSLQQSSSTNQGGSGQFNPYFEAEMMILKSALYAEGVRSSALKGCAICVLQVEHWIREAAKKVAESHPPSPHPQHS